MLRGTETPEFDEPAERIVALYVAAIGDIGAVTLVSLLVALVGCSHAQPTNQPGDPCTFTCSEGMKCVRQRGEPNRCEFKKGRCQDDVDCERDERCRKNQKDVPCKQCEVYHCACVGVATGFCEKGFPLR